MTKENQIVKVIIKDSEDLSLCVSVSFLKKLCFPSKANSKSSKTTLLEVGEDIPDEESTNLNRPPLGRYYHPRTHTQKMTESGCRTRQGPLSQPVPLKIHPSIQKASSRWTSNSYNVPRASRKTLELAAVGNRLRPPPPEIAALPDGWKTEPNLPLLRQTVKISLLKRSSIINASSVYQMVRPPPPPSGKRVFCLACGCPVK
ncbi:hypothetical protein CDAR_243531 [Caerostris darwini]|uniref:Uncharacterized protein n=1 Tax=Caerostris darwini TaxID=1538125 RepID=A0AAV4VEN9_9ARAC|nr:hypothetical protein CDAR_243531 [Caerostris darwini]